MKTKLHIAIIFILSLVWLVLSQAVGFAATYYVDAINGDDSTGNGLSWAQAWKTISKVQAEISAGDTVILRTGDYGKFTDTFSDDIISGEPYTYTLPPETLWTTWKADSGHTPVFSKSGDYAIELGTSFDMRKGAIIFDGIRVEGPVKISGVYGVRINNCEVVGTEPYIGDAKGGIHLRYSGDIVINNCEIHHSNVYGISAFLGNNNITMTNNEIYDTGGDCIGIKSEHRDNSNFLIEGNTVRDNTLWNTAIHADGIQLDGTGNDYAFTNFVIRNNTISNIDSASIIIDATLTPDLIIENNLVTHDSAQVLISDTVDMIVRNNTFDCSFRLHSNNVGSSVYNNIILGAINYDTPQVVDHNFNIVTNNFRGYAVGWNEPNGIDYENADAAKAALFDTGYQLKATAPAVDFYTGVAATEATPVDDILYNSRDISPDAGCYEYGSPRTTYYVDKDNPNASDDNPGTEELPWKTLTKAANTAQAGDTVLVKAGIYYETLAPINSGTAGNLITFKTYPSDNAIIDAEGKTYAVDLNGKSYIRIEGFEIRNSSNWGIYITGNNIGVEIVSNNIHHNCKKCNNNVPPDYWKYGRGITVAKATDLLIQNNEIHHNDVDGIKAETTHEDIINLRIIGNHIYANDHDGINGGGGSNWLIEGNIIHDHDDPKGEGTHPDNIQIQRGNLNGLVIRNNIFYDATQNIYVANHIYGVIENVEIYGNLIYKDDYDYLWPKGIFVGGRTDPLGFVRNVKIYDNTVYNTYPGISFDINVEGNVTIRNNILSNTHEAISFVEMVAEIDSDYNLFNGGAIKWYGTWYNTFSQFRAATGLEPNSIDADPEFVDSSNFDFHLKPTSPAIDTGEPALAVLFTLPDPFLDLDGNRRYYGMGYDIGAYEYTLLPKVVISAKPKQGYLPLTVLFSISELVTPNGKIETWKWDFGDGTTSQEKEPSHTYTSPREYTATLIVTDIEKYQGQAQTNITVLEKEKEFEELSIGCYNNVFNPTKEEEALIWVELSKQARVKVDLYNTRGNRIRKLVDEERDAETCKYYWNGKDDNGNVVGSGLYFVHIQAGNFKKTKKIVVVK